MTPSKLLQYVHDIPKVERRWNNLSKDQRRLFLVMVKEPSENEMLKTITKVKSWNYTRAKLKKEFAEMNIVSCEICGGTFALSFAHRLKRRLITSDLEMRYVALLCQKCHEIIEFSGLVGMYRRITEIVENRNEQITTT